MIPGQKRLNDVQYESRRALSQVLPRLDSKAVPRPTWSSKPSMPLPASRSVPALHGRASRRVSAIPGARRRRRWHTGTARQHSPSAGTGRRTPLPQWCRLPPLPQLDGRCLTEVSRQVSIGRLKLVPPTLVRRGAHARPGNRQDPRHGSAPLPRTRRAAQGWRPTTGSSISASRRSFVRTTRHPFNTFTTGFRE